MSQQAYKLHAFDAETLTDETLYSPEYDVNSIRPLGNFAAQLHVSGAGTVDIDLYTSINGENFIFSRNLYTAASAVNGPASDGKQLDSMGMEVCMKFKFLATATGSATVSLWIGVQ